MLRHRRLRARSSFPPLLGEDVRLQGAPWPLLRESYRNDLRAMWYVRFHAIFRNEHTRQGHASYNFSYVDQIYDGL